MQPADLIGRTLVDDQGRTLTIRGLAPWSANYMELDDGDSFRTARNTGLLLRYFADPPALSTQRPVGSE